MYCGHTGDGIGLLVSLFKPYVKIGSVRDFVSAKIKPHTVNSQSRTASRTQSRSRSRKARRSRSSTRWRNRRGAAKRRRLPPRFDPIAPKDDTSSDHADRWWGGWLRCGGRCVCINPAVGEKSGHDNKTNRMLAASTALLTDNGKYPQIDCVVDTLYHRSVQYGEEGTMPIDVVLHHIHE